MGALSHFSFTTKRGNYIAELGYSFSVAGILNSGRYKREFPTQQEADEFVRDLQDKAVAVHYNPAELSSSALLEPDIKFLLQIRAPAPAADYPGGAELGSRLDQTLPLALCLFFSLWVHLGAVMGRRVAPGAFFWMLRVGIFVVWFPAVLVAQRLVGNLNRRDLWKVVLKGSPDWMRYMVYVFFVYAFVNFLLFIGKTPSGSSGTNPPASVWRGFSGHWMSLYSAVLAILYTGARAVDTSPRCGNGHSALPNSTYCPKCGQPVMRVR
jgi:hypothetical protein